MIPAKILESLEKSQQGLTLEQLYELDGYNRKRVISNLKYLNYLGCVKEITNQNKTRCVLARGGKNAHA